MQDSWNDLSSRKKLGNSRYYFFPFRTAKDIQVLDYREIPPIRTEYIDVLGQGAFGKVHRAKLKDGLEYFLIGRGWENITARRHKIVAVKELHGKCEQFLHFVDSLWKGNWFLKVN